MRASQRHRRAQVDNATEQIMARHMKEVEGFEAQIGAERERQAAAMRQRLASLRATKKKETMRQAQAAR